MSRETESGRREVHRGTANWLHSLKVVGLSIVGLIFFCLTPTFATITMAWILCWVIDGLGLSAWWSWRHWVIFSPIIYVSWLNSFLIACAIDLQAWRLLFGYRKRARVTTSNGWRDKFQFQLMQMNYTRQIIVRNLPLTRVYQCFEGLRMLVLLAGSLRAKVGKQSVLIGIVYDPDLTEIGDGVILGDGGTLVAHSLTSNPDGSKVFVTAPIVVGPRAVIGGLARIDLGVQIGADAIVEPMSYVMPFTVIGDGEVWGGNPARFKRLRFEPSESSGRIAPLGDQEVASTIHASVLTAKADEESLCQIVASALDLRLDEVHSDLSFDQCPAWDSLGQLAIAAALHDRLGIILSANESFGLKSMGDLRKVIAKNSSKPTVQLAVVSRSEQPADEKALPLPDDPELLPLLDHELVTRGLAARGGGTSTIQGSVSVVIAATFVAEPLANSLKLWSQAFGIAIDVRFAGFNQVPQCLMTPGSEFHQNGTGLNVVLTRPEDLLSATSADSHEVAESLLTAIAAFAQQSPGTLVVGSLPPVVSAFCAADRSIVESLRADWRNRLRLIDGVRILDFSELVEHIGIGAAGRSDLEAVARSPYTPRVYQELGIAIARLIRQQRIAPAKVIALDADGVLWGGVLGEDGLTGIQLSSDHPGRSFQLFQRHVRSLKDRGCLLVLVSRNEAEDVWRVFDEHPEMILRRDDITAARIDWQPKSQNLKELAVELNLGLDSFVFVDDDPVNRAEVAANAPGVTVVPLSTDAASYCQTMSQLWRFDTPQVTHEDQHRAALMHAEQQRNQDRNSSYDLALYLQSLRLRVEMRLARDVELPRVSQLTQKTNQFNLSLKRRSLAEIQALAATHRIYVVESSDRFGDYGLIGVAIVARDADRPDEFMLDTLLLSCRALGRGIEEAVWHGLCSTIVAQGGSRLIAPAIVGPRNQPCLDFLRRTGLTERDTGVFELDAVASHALPPHIEWHSLELPAERWAA